jgi:hypothetical protein
MTTRATITASEFQTIDAKIGVYRHLSGEGFYIGRDVGTGPLGRRVIEPWSPKGWLPWEPQVWGEGRFRAEDEARAVAATVAR